MTFSLSDDDIRVVCEQRAITQKINKDFIQVGAVFLKPRSKIPSDADWNKKSYLDTNLQSWIDEPDLRYTNLGFNLQLGWVDVDIDSPDADFNRCIQAAISHLGIDGRFAFGRRSVGAPTHFFIQLPEEEASSFDELRKFEPLPIRLGNKQFHVQLRSSMLGVKTDLESKQTVVPGSIYVDKINSNGHDISVWWSRGEVARVPDQIAVTTSRRVTFRELIRAVAFGTTLFLLRPHWVEGSRQNIATRVFGWLARVVGEGEAINNSENLSEDVYCPIDCDATAESLIEFICKELGDSETFMRKRTYKDAREKLQRNPDAKIPGWPALEQLFGAEVAQCLRTVVRPGSDISALAKLIDNYIYDQSADEFIDRRGFAERRSRFMFPKDALYTRHKPDTIIIKNKQVEAFKLFERSKLRVDVSESDMFPQYEPGAIVRHSRIRDELTDDGDLLFNTWPGWPIKPPATVNPKILTQCESYLNQVLDWLTDNHTVQREWVKKNIAFTVQNPGIKQQVAWVSLGEQGTGKSFIGSTFLRSLFGNLHGTLDTREVGGTFSIAPLINKVFVFGDEVKFKNSGAVTAVKQIVREVHISGQRKGIDERGYNIFARLIFAANNLDIRATQEDTVDRALYYTKTVNPTSMNMSRDAFKLWVNGLKPFFTEFADFLRDYDNRAHFMELFYKIPVTRAEIEDVRSSAAMDSDIISSNLSLPRRIGKLMIENGQILPDMDITFPFRHSDFCAAVTEFAKKVGLPNIQGERVLKDLHELGMLEDVRVGSLIKIRFRWRMGTLFDEFEKATGVILDRQFQFGPGDYGPNDADGAKPIQWRGSRERRF